MDSILTKGSPIKGIILFSIPLLLGNIFQQIYTLSDTLIVGRVVGVQALAAVGATSGLTFLIIGFDDDRVIDYHCPALWRGGFTSGQTKFCN